MAFVWILLALAALWLYLAFPSPGRRRARRWCGLLFAHRGLYDPAEGRAENCLRAFSAACEAGYAIELDVRFSADGTLVVHHDDTLRRVFGEAARVDELDLPGLRTLRAQTGETLPTFDEVLELVSGRVPLLIEIKTCPDIAALTEAVCRRLRDYSGEYVVESFNPLALRWLKKRAPQVVRGQLVAGFADTAKAQNPALAFALCALLLNFLARPDFIAYDAARRTLGVRVQRALFRTPMFAWTIRDMSQCSRLHARGEGIIFEGIRPKI